MLKMLQSLDRKLESFIHEMDRTLQEPITQAMTFEVFRHDDDHRSHTATQPLFVEAEIDVDCVSESPANPCGPAVRGTMNRDAVQDLSWL